MRQPSRGCSPESWKRWCLRGTHRERAAGPFSRSDPGTWQAMFAPHNSIRMQPDVDALLIVSFGGPEKPGDVMPFLENVARGRSIPRERLLEVAEHYCHFGGRSPINDQNRALIAALKEAGCP